MHNRFLKNILYVLQRRLYTSSHDEAGKLSCDVAIIGGGIVGTAIAKHLKECHNNLRVHLLEKEHSLGLHQSSHNSGVMHSGIYYKPGSLKAKFCVDGLEMLKRYCDEKNICYKRCGKLIIATNQQDTCTLQELFERGLENQVKSIEILPSLQEIRKICSGCMGVQALWNPNVANVNFNQVTCSFGEDFKSYGGTIVFNFKVHIIEHITDGEYPILLTAADNRTVLAKYLIICAGLQSEELSRVIVIDESPNSHYMSLKVDYQLLESQHCDNVNTNIYSAPDLSVPFLGAHFSPLLNGDVLLGPSAIPALRTEGYQNDEINLEYMKNLALSSEFRNMVFMNFSKCVDQAVKHLWQNVQIKALQNIVPNLSYQYIRMGPTAVQCQLLTSDGCFVDDFVIDFFKGNELGKRTINLRFTPSPAATSCLAIAKCVVEEFAKVMEYSTRNLEIK